MAGQQGASLPGEGKFGGRMRNTMGNILSHNKIDYKNPGGESALPSLDPASTANYYSQLAGLYAQYQSTLVGLKQQRVGLRTNFQEAKAGIRAEKLAGLSTTENDAVERGVLGGTADLQARTDVRAGAAAAKASAKNDMLEGVASTRLQAQQAGISYFQESASLEAQKLAQQQQLLAQQLEQNLIISGQESQMDALKDMYKALSQGLFGDDKNKKAGPQAPDYSFLDPNALIPGVNMTGQQMADFKGGY